MAKGENIFRRKDGRWEARYIKGYDQTGKIIYGFCYGKTYKEAKEKVTRTKSMLINSDTVFHSRQKFSYFCDRWFESGKTRFKESTCVKYKNILDKHIKPTLGRYFPLELNNELIEKFSNELCLQKELAPKTVKDILVVLRSILDATAKQFPNIFPIIDIVYPKENKKEMRVLSREEQSRFISYLSEDLDECKFGILLALLTGIRLGELCALKWENISLTDKTIKITSTMQRLKDLDRDQETKTKIVIGSPKSNMSIRTIPMSNYAAELCWKMNPQSPAAFILTGTLDYMEPRKLQYRMENSQ